MEKFTIKINNLTNKIKSQLSTEELESVMRSETWADLMQAISDSVNTHGLIGKACHPYIGKR